MNPTFNDFALQPLPHSRGALGMVVVAHVAAALLIVQLFEARRYVEPVPLLVSLLSAPPQTESASTSPVQQPPERMREVDSEPEPLPLPEPPRQVKFEPEPAPPPKPAPVQTLPEPVVEKIIEPAPMPPAPEPPPRAITEVPVPPPAPEPVIAAAPEPQSVSAPEAVPVATPIPPLPPEPLPIIVAEPAPQQAIAPPAQAAQPPAEVTMTAEMLTAIYLSNPKPGYPNVSRRLREQGTVLLRVFVTVAGDPHKVELKSSSGFARLDRAAHDAVQRWKFVPAKRGGEPVDAWVVVPIKFSLKG